MLAAAAWAVSEPLNDWKVAGPFGGTATALTVDPRNPSVVLAGAMDSLLFRSQDSGASWDVLNFPKRNLSEVSSILVDKADPSHYLVGVVGAAGGGLFETHDDAKTWTAAKDIQNFGVRALAASASDPSRFVAGTLRGVMLSDDSGKTWRRISDPDNLEMQGITAVAIDTQDPNVIYAGTTHLPWKTMDAGKTWESIHSGMIDDSDVFSISIDPAQPNDILASACSGIYSSRDRGDLWHKLLGIPNTSRRTHVVREDPFAAGTIYAGTTTGLFKSVDRGTTWKTLSDTQVNALAFDPAHAGSLYVGFEYQGLGKSNDGGGKIELANRGFVDRVVSSVTLSGKKLVAVETQEGETSGLFISDDWGESWYQLRDPRGLGGVHLRAIAGMSSEDRILLAASPRQMYQSIDAAASWKPVPIRLIVTPPAAEKTRPPGRTVRSNPHAKQTAGTRSSAREKSRITTREIFPAEISGLYCIKSGMKEMFFAATDLGLLTSSDAGERWSLAGIPEAMGVTALYSAPNSNGYLVARTIGGLYFSKDFGDHWTALPFPLPPSDVNDVAVPADASAPLLVATRVGLYSSPDSGGNWYKNVGGMPASTVNSVTYSGLERTAYAVEYGRLYETKNAGDSWTEIPTAFASLRIRRLWMPDIGSNRLYGITSDLGILFRN